MAFDVDSEHDIMMRSCHPDPGCLAIPEASVSIAVATAAHISLYHGADSASTVRAVQDAVRMLKV